MANKQAVSVDDAFERALGVIRARVFASVGRIAIAYSGGLDSSVLLHVAHAWANVHCIELFAFHIHHGLSPNADGWLSHCERESAALGVNFDARRIHISTSSGDGIEQAARHGRYAALGDLCRAHDVPLLLTAHHLDDQAETVLLQLLRGAGVAGMSGMEQVSDAPSLVGGVSPQIARPLLALSRADLEQYAARHRFAYVDDESNADIRYARNALRNEIVPALTQHFPGFQQRVARSADHSRAAQRLLEELAASDLRVCAEGDCIDIDRLRQLSDDRMDNMLRHWFARRRVRMPSTAWLAQMREQLLAAREDAQVRIVHPDCEIRRHRNRMYLIPRDVDAGAQTAALPFRWQGEAVIRFPSFGGVLRFEPAEHGIDAQWLREQSLEIRRRSSGEKLKLAPNRPSRSLKHHYQELDIPVWEREHLPVIIASGRLVFAAGVGMNWKDLPTGDGSAVCLRWNTGIID